MAATRDVPYPSFNFTVNFDGQEVFGGFSDVSGLMTEVTIAEYRNGNELENHVHKIQGMNKSGDVTLKRGVIDSSTMWAWINQTRTQGPAAKKTVVITLLDERREPRQTWRLEKVIPLKWTGPTLAGKGGGDVAMEEIVLSVEVLKYGTAGA
jgi:phage tail-like protein